MILGGDKVYQDNKEQIKRLFETCPFTIDSLKHLDDHASRLWAKFRHIENVASLMESSAKMAGLSEKEKLMAFAAGQFHDIACINDIALTGKEYGPQHGARGAIITFGILTQQFNGFTKEEIEAITTAIANHDGATPEDLSGFTKTLTLMLRDCDKVDCYRRLATEPLEGVFQRPLVFDSPIRQEFALDCIAGKPMKYAEMQNFNEEALLYLGWYFQLNNLSCQKAAFPFFEALAERILQTTKDSDTKSYTNTAIKKAQSITQP
ncbi:HD domain-containing protein [Candidatus Saccharibacteria bacterium]|nr:HD domain-containing protein [Candidatus Saccharibacteria bacterium]